MSDVSLTSVAVYRRRIGASLERVWENVRDWEHLPWLHDSSFCAIEHRDSGDWGWRASVALPPADAGQEMVIELRIDPPEQRYVVRTLEGLGAGSEIWTRLAPAGSDATDIEVEFFLADVAPSTADGLGAAYTALYTRLWDEDESMMQRRAHQLSSRADRTAQLDLGSLADLRANLPMTVELGGRSYRIVDLDGELHVYDGACPHMLGPLEAAPDADHCVACPWHGYRFDLRTGRSADARGLRLLPAPVLEHDADSGEVRLCWSGAT